MSHPSIMIPVVTWPELRALLNQGKPCIAAERGGFWDLTVPEFPYATCELPTAQFRKQLIADDPELARYFPESWSADFETNYLPRFPGRSPENPPHPQWFRALAVAAVVAGGLLGYSLLRLFA